VTALGATVVLIPGAPLIAILVLTQALNAVLLLPLLVFMYRIAPDRDLMGDYVAGPVLAASYLVAIALIGVCVVALGVVSIA
jgi:Mn2+/Fe2+ NRAMP family transporter